MEYTQWAIKITTNKNIDVLILVVMEYTQWVGGMFFNGSPLVLILVVMEYTQWEQRLTYPLYKAF